MERLSVRKKIFGVAALLSATVGSAVFVESMNSKDNPTNTSMRERSTSTTAGPLTDVPSKPQEKFCTEKIKEVQENNGGIVIESIPNSNNQTKIDKYVVRNLGRLAASPNNPNDITLNTVEIMHGEGKTNEKVIDGISEKKYIHDYGSSTVQQIHGGTAEFNVESTEQADTVLVIARFCSENRVDNVILDM